MLDSDTRELLRAGRVLSLTPKAFQLLTTLIDNAPRAVSKRELQDLLWPDTFVIEANLQHLIGEIRTALSEDHRHPRFIRTVHGFGYAFKAEPARVDVRAAVVCRLETPGGPVTLAEGEHLIGRDAAARVVIDSSTVSRRHARIIISASAVTLEDLGSRNGSFVSGRRVSGVVPLGDGDTVRFGRVAMVLRVYSRLGTTRSSSAG